MRAATALAPILFLISAPAWAATDEQAWVALSASVKAARHTTVTADVSQRFRSDSVGANQVQARVFVEQALSKAVSVGGGMVYAGSATTSELRPTQYVNVSHGVVSLRTMLEERVFSGPGQMGMRLRERAMARFPLGKRDRLSFWVEPFFVLRPTTKGKRGGLEQIRFGLAEEHAISPHFSVTAGYLLIDKTTKGAPDRYSNVAQLTLSWKG